MKLTTAVSLFHFLRIVDLNQRLEGLDQEIQAFAKKAVMDIEEMGNNVENLSQITANLEAAVMEVEVRDTTLKGKD